MAKPMLRLQLVGAKDTNAALRAMTPAMRRKLGQKALNRAGKLMRDELRNAAPNTFLKRSIGQRRKTYRKNGAVMRIVGVRSNYRGTNTELEQYGDAGRVGVLAATLGNWIEFGTTRIAARPWVRPAADRNQTRVQQLISRDIDEAVKAAAKEVRR